MKVFDLACEHDHRFEGWFASSADYDEQCAKGLIECPMCGSTSIRKLPAAPRLNLSGGEERAAPPAAPTPEQIQAMWMKMARHIAQNTEDVGANFAEEARRIHYREAPERGIRGTASKEDAQALQEEGIEVFSFPMPKALKTPLQ